MMPSSPTTFRVRISPDWQALHPLILQRAKQLGMVWPSSSHPARFPRVYTVTLAGQLGSEQGLSLDVLALEPPKETTVQKALPTWEALRTSFKIAGKRAFTEANPQGPSADVLAVQLDQQGLFLPAVEAPALPLERLTDLPLEAMVQTFFDVAQGNVTLKRTAIDHIVERYTSPPGFEHCIVSRWRGEPFYRLAVPTARLELEFTDK